ncbi:MAG TPA: hypothetical protein VHH88_02770 [Verrucomicrobiae bacterium]|nr:hypothetical protein [Verrucomicrobiae bacterium]
MPLASALKSAPRIRGQKKSRRIPQFASKRSTSSSATNAIASIYNFWRQVLRDRSGGATLITVWREETDMPAAQKLLDEKGIWHDTKKNSLKFRVWTQAISQNPEVFERLAGLMKDY